jgi:hypothetical protein
MQIKINVISLSDYYEKISRGIFDFLQAFKECCPICYAKNCAVRIGFYFRMAVDIETGLIIEKLMIIRFLCRRKGKPKIKDRTFSLLVSVKPNPYKVSRGINTIVFPEKEVLSWQHNRKVSKNGSYGRR